MWGAYTVFERLAPAPILEKIIDTPLHANSRLGSSYADPRRPGGACPDPPQTVDNVHALIGWLKRRAYVPRRGTDAYRQVIDAVAAIAEVAQGEIQTLDDGAAPNGARDVRHVATGGDCRAPGQRRRQEDHSTGLQMNQTRKD